MQSLVPYSRIGLGYTIGRGLDAVLPFTCYYYWFSCYFDQRKINENPLTRPAIAPSPFREFRGVPLHVLKMAPPLYICK
jgi:hypothetical protein